MKKITITQSFFFTLLILFSACSEMRYPNLKKIDASWHSENKTFSSNKKSNENTVDTVALSSNENPPAENNSVVTNNDENILASTAKINPVLGKPLKNFGKINCAKTEKKKVSVDDGDYRMHSGLLWTIVLVFLILWLLSLLTGGWGLGGLLYLFLVVALVVILLRLLGIL